jgi:hypothetical protein
MGCHYFANRIRDLGDCFRIQAGGGLGLGASAEAAGIMDLGLVVGVAPRQGGLGWVYGDGYFFGLGENGDTWDGVVDYSAAAVVGVVLAVAAGFRVGTSYPRDPPPPGEEKVFPGFHWEIVGSEVMTLRPSYAQHGCYSFFPWCISRVGPEEPWPDALPLRDHPAIFTGEALHLNPRAHLHAFDVEASVYLGIVWAKAGFSPGEMLDFLLGWFGIDIGGDDWAIAGW